MSTSKFPGFGILISGSEKTGKQANYILL